MNHLAELRVRAVLENVRIISYFLQGVGHRLHLTEKTLFDIELAVEEAVVNIINHAYTDVEHGQILIEIDEDLETDSLKITLSDWGVPLNPQDVTPFDISAPIDTRISGGMGLYLIQSLMDEVERVSGGSDVPNKLIMVKELERLHPGAQQPSVARELNAMLSISRVATSGIGLDQLLERIVNMLVDVIDAERGTLYLVDAERGELYSRVLLKGEDVLQEIRMPVDAGVAGEVVSLGRILNIHDPYSHKRFNPAFDQITGFKTRNMLVAPMLDSQKQIIGVVQVLNKQDGAFSSRDERLLGALAAQAAINIENARLHEHDLRQQLMEQELETARGIQTSFLPNEGPVHPDWEISSYWLPMREVGGEFFDFHTLPDGRLAVAIADVSGKGVPAALFMAFVVTVIRFAMSLDFEPADLLARANLLILADQRSRMFATAFVGYLDFNTGDFQFASAGHNPPLLYRAETGMCHLLSAKGVAMGAFERASYSGNHVKIEPGDILVMYTDGITEAIDDNEEEFGEDRLESVIRENAALSAIELSELITTTISEFSHERDFDDETLVILKRKPR